VVLLNKMMGMVRRRSGAGVTLLLLNLAACSAESSPPNETSAVQKQWQGKIASVS